MKDPLEHFFSYFDHQYSLLCNEIYGGRYEVKQNDLYYDKVFTFWSKIKSIYQDSTIGQNFLYDYLTFQYSFYKDTKLTNKNILSWLIGDKAINRWLNKPDEWLYHLMQFRQEFNLIKSNFLIKDVVDLSYEEQLKQNYKNKIAHPKDMIKVCLSLTTLYRKDSEICQTCSCKQQCRVIKIRSYAN